MNVTLKLYGTLRDKTTGGQTKLEFELPEGSTVGDLRKLAGVHEETYVVSLVNGKRVFDNEILKDGDDVSIFPPVGGGAE